MAEKKRRKPVRRTTATALREALQMLADATEHKGFFDTHPRSLIGVKHLPLYDAYKLARAVLQATRRKEKA